MRNYTYARIAYEAYCKNRNWKSVKGEPLPHFDQQLTELQDAWWEAAEAVRSFIQIQSSPG
jgi:hypothetical protein